MGHHPHQDSKLNSRLATPGGGKQRPLSRVLLEGTEPLCSTQTGVCFAFDGCHPPIFPFPPPGDTSWDSASSPIATSYKPGSPSFPRFAGPRGPLSGKVKSLQEPSGVLISACFPPFVFLLPPPHFLISSPNVSSAGEGGFGWHMAISVMGLRRREGDHVEGSHASFSFPFFSTPRVHVSGRVT